jgi:hypothetical protein
VIRFPWVAAGLMAAAAPASLAATPPAHCPISTDASAPADSLPHVAAVLKRGGSLDILAVGAGSVTGAPAPSQGPAHNSPILGPNGFLGQVARDLNAGAPGLHTALTLRGGRGLTAAAQLDIIRAALGQHHYQLVLWQTGTLDAVQAEPADRFYQTLADGADAVAGAGADLVLIDPQYSRFLSANTDINPYLAAMEAVGALPDVMLFHRYDLMHDWEDSGLIDLEDADAADRPATAARLHACLAAALAHSLLPGQGSADAPASEPGPPALPR